MKTFGVCDSADCSEQTEQTTEHGDMLGGRIRQEDKVSGERHWHLHEVSREGLRKGVTHIGGCMSLLQLL